MSNVKAQPEYGSFNAARNRCRPSDKDSARYYERGIRFLYKDFWQFIEDVGPRPTAQHTLDRIDNNGHYGPGNCRWSTPKEQANNRRDNVWVEHQGSYFTVSQLSEKLGINKSTLLKRVEAGISLTKPAEEYHAGSVTWRGKTQSQREWARETGIKQTTIAYRLKKGWSVEDALTRPPLRPRRRPKP